MSCYNYPITVFVHEQQHFRWKLALKCDETEASGSENTLQSIKNYKSLANVKKNYIFAQTIFTHFWGQYRKNSALWIIRFTMVSIH